MRYVLMSPVDVWRLTDPISLKIIPFSDVVDGIEPRRRPAMQPGGRKLALCHSLGSVTTNVIRNQTELFQRSFEVVDDFLGDDVGYDL